MAHEYSHWMRTQLSDDETPPELGYSHARGKAKEGQGESGFAAEIAIFNGFIQANPSSHGGGYRDFRLVDRYNVAHHLPRDQIERYWTRERFQPLVLNNPIYTAVGSIPTTVESSIEQARAAKLTTAESVLRPTIPPCPCAPFLILPEMQMSAISAEMPNLDLMKFDREFVKLEEETADINLKMVTFIAMFSGNSTDETGSGPARNS